MRMTCRVMGKDREFFHQASKVDWREQLLLMDEKNSIDNRQQFKSCCQLISRTVLCTGHDEINAAGTLLKQKGQLSEARNERNFTFKTKLIFPQENRSFSG